MALSSWDNTLAPAQTKFTGGTLPNQVGNWSLLLPDLTCFLFWYYWKCNRFSSIEILFKPVYKMHKYSSTFSYNELLLKNPYYNLYLYLSWPAIGANDITLAGRNGDIVKTASRSNKSWWTPTRGGAITPSTRIPALALSQQFKFSFQTLPAETRMAATTGDEVGFRQEATVWRHQHRQGVHSRQ